MSNKMFNCQDSSIGGSSGIGVDIHKSCCYVLHYECTFLIIDSQLIFISGDNKISGDVVTKFLSFNFG